jgi:hypothetical protein
LARAGVFAAAAVTGALALTPQATAAEFPPGPTAVEEIDALDGDEADVAAVLAADERSPLQPCL